ncbi:integral membrane protein [Aspergillus steynii IBT 23096]|uniref:Integral membrane protein n=1 Tax=Aspergillus steynii IBT 23096 TaxID=1392250 RepID=A0A2I2G7X5_9EURO|nr:uncharacterized protein P170DRAFT_509642 [Aspergillus steynii IBT 23096]PLB48980.1 integral membrane protein [Aspergillus steynii IBT 23096]
MSIPAAPFLVLSDDNHGPLVTLVSVAFLIATIIFVAAKFVSAIYFKQRQTIVNTPIWIGLVLAIIQVVLMQKAVDHGLGRHFNTLKTTKLHKASKFVYAAQLIQITILSLSKVSTTLLVWRLTPNNQLRRACAITIGLTTAWTLFALFGIAFQCQMPHPWLYSPERCAGQGVLVYPISVFHILLEIIIIVLPFFMMRDVQMAWQKSFKILCSFSARLIIVCLAISQLVLLPPFLRSSDPTWDIITPAICGQVMMCATITIACLPTLYHIFAGLHSGLITTRLPDEVELTHPKKSAYINQSTISGSRAREGPTESKHRSFLDTRSFRNSVSAVITDISISGRQSQNGRDTMWRSSSESARHLAEEPPRPDGVLKTVDITVQVEEHRSESQGSLASR